jgi:hypothetical protein
MTGNRVSKGSKSMEKEKNLQETLKTDFPALTEKNKKSVLEMTKFLVLTQNAIVPSMLADTESPAPPNEAGKEGLA